MERRDLRVRFGISGRNKEPIPYVPKILYSANDPLSGGWISENCTSTEWHPNTHEGVLNLRRGVTSIGGSQSTDSSPFYGASYVTAVDLSGCEITEIGDYAFRGCVSLTSFEIPADITAIGSNAFNGCTNLTEVTCLAIEPPTLGTGNFGKSGDVLYVPEESVSAYRASSAWSSAFNMIVPIGFEGVLRYNAGSAVSGTWVSNYTDTTRNTYDSESGDGVLYLNAGVNWIGIDSTSSTANNTPFYNKTDLVSVDFTDSGMTNIGYSAFYGCTGLTSVMIGSDVNTIGYNDYVSNNPFKGCSALASITVDPNNATFTDGNGCNCIMEGNSLRVGCKNTVMPNGVVGIAHNAFNGSGVTSVTIPNSVTVVGKAAFANCASLTSVSVGSGVWKFGDYPSDDVAVFAGCTALTTMTVDPNNTNYSDGSGSNGIFYKLWNNTLSLRYGCKNTVIPNGTSIIAEGAFEGIATLTSITFPDSVIDIEEGAFRNTGLTSIDLGNGVRYIRRSAFRNTGLTSITLPSSLLGIEGAAFAKCTNLTSVTCEATTPPTLGSSNFTASNDTLYVPASSVSAYQSASAWSSAFTTITAIPTPVQHTISYTTADPQWGASAVDGNWVTNNTDTAQNTYTTVAGQYGNIGEGVLYLNSGVTTIGGGQSTDYSPFYESRINHQTSTIDLSNSGLTSIGDYGLYDSSVEFDPSNPLVIPEGVTTIGDHALGASGTGGSDCYYDLPSTLTSIASNGIYIGGSKGGIAVMVCRAATPPTLGTNSISAPDGLWELQVPSASVSAYQSSAWGSLGFSSITAIP